MAQRDGLGPLAVVGVRHHSPVCAHLVRRTIEALEPAQVLVEGPADMNDRIDELLLGHQLPVAIFSSSRQEGRVDRSWSPLCEHSPEWVALVSGRAVGAQVRFMDMPAWDPAFWRCGNRYSDVGRYYDEVHRRLCDAFGVDNADVLWDHLFEVPDDADLDVRLAAYFDLIRAGLPPADGDRVREDYMARWVRAARQAAGPRPVVVVCGGYHRPALLALAAAGEPDAAGWPPVPGLPPGAVGGSHLVPYSFRRLDAFDGYDSGMPSPGYYQDMWEVGAREAAERVVRRVVTRLRARQQVVSTADLVAAAAVTQGLARLRGHDVPARADVLDGLLSALLDDALDQPPPWAGRGRLSPDAEPVVAEMVAALAGDAVGRLHPDTPAPPLVRDVEEELARHAIPDRGMMACDLTEADGRARARVLHRLRALDLPGWVLASTSGDGLEEHWACQPDEHRHAALVEAGSYGRTLAEAAAAFLEEDAAGSPDALARVLEAAVRCGLDETTGRVVAALTVSVGKVQTLRGLGGLLSLVVTLLRDQDRRGAAPGPEVGLGLLARAALRRALWLLEGERGAMAVGDAERQAALAGVRDAARHLREPGGLDRTAVLDLAARTVGDPDRPADLRGGCAGLLWTLAPDADVTQRVRLSTAHAQLGDWLAGLFAVAREEVLRDTDDGVLAEVDRVLSRLPQEEFLAAVPALRQAFAWFPPREREQVAARVLARRGLTGSARSLLLVTADPGQVARALAVEARVDVLLAREALLSAGGSG